MWIFKEFFVITPKEEEKTPEKETAPEIIASPEQQKINSVVGTTIFEPLKAPPPKMSKVVSAEEFENVFSHENMDHEYPEPKQEQQEPIPETEQKEVLSTGENTTDEDKQIQETICTDAEQIEVSIKKTIRDEPLDIRDAKTLLALEGTAISIELRQAIATYEAVISTLLSNAEVELINQEV